MVNAWIVASIVAVVGGAVGFFVVLRGSAFVAHAVPNGSFAGAAAASLVGVNTLLGLGVFAVGGALGIGFLGRRGRHDVATALTLVFMLGLGALFLSFSVAVRARDLLAAVRRGARHQHQPARRRRSRSPRSAWPCSALLYRRLLLSSVLPDSAPARGVALFGVELGFLLLVALATTMTVPVVGTALIFSLMIGPPAAARSFTTRPYVAIALSIGIAARRRLGGDRALLPDQLAGRLLRRHRERRGLRRRAHLELRAPEPRHPRRPEPLHPSTPTPRRLRTPTRGRARRPTLRRPRTPTRGRARGRH